MMETIEIDGSEYGVLFRTSEFRAIVKYDGDIPVCVDRLSDGTWQLSGQPAEGVERDIIVKYSPAMDVTETTVTKDD